ncbi:MAG: hypothetical protein LBN33_00775, partial [Desulfovibrio sp.]|nr:hypothetical protein [Desulfovibrio sp.]
MATQLISAPEGTYSVKVDLASTLTFAFDIQTSSFDREGDNLIITLEDGRKVVLEDFFIVEKEGDDLPTLQLADGTEVASADFLLSMNPDLDVTASGATAGSGSDYADNAGEGLDGVDGMGKLGTDHWSGGVSHADPIYLTDNEGDVLGAVNGQRSDSVNTLPPPPPVTPPVVPPVTPPVEPPVTPPVTPPVDIVVEAIVVGGKAAATVEGGNLVFTIAQNVTSSAATTANWSITVPAAATDGRASYADLDSANFGGNITVTPSIDGSSYTLSGMITIPAGATSTSVTIPTLDDAIIENDETLTFNLSNVANPAADSISGGGSYTALISDNDHSLVVSGNPAVTVEGGDLVFTISQNAESSAPTTANWSVTVPATADDGRASYADLDTSKFADNNITAYDNGDGSWTLIGVITIPAGSTSTSITIPTLEDAIIELDETLTLNLTDVANAA